MSRDRGGGREGKGGVRGCLDGHWVLRQRECVADQLMRVCVLGDLSMCVANVLLGVGMQRGAQEKDFGSRCLTLMFRH